MALHELNIGARARTRDGDDAGEIEKLILHPDTNEVEGFLLDRGLFTPAKIVEAGFIEETGEGGVTLSVTLGELESLPTFAHEQLRRTPGNLTYPAGMIGHGFADVSGSGSQWMVQGAGHGGLPGTGGVPFFIESPIGTLETINVSNMPEGTVLVSEGTDVVGTDGKKVGTVDEVLLDDENRVVGLLVRAGFLFKHDVELPMSMVAAVTEDHIRLNVPGEDAEIYSERQKR